MKTSQAGNSILPNTFQHPNIFIDKLMYYLEPEENVVLTFAVRRILGFQENISSRKDNISLSQFVDGVKSTKDGSELSKGCGLGVSAVRDVLDTLLHIGVLLPTTPKPDPRKGQEYWLQDNVDNIDWEWLERRKAEKHEKGQKRTAKARSVVRQKGAVGQKAKESVPQQARGQSDNNTKPMETHGNPVKEGASAAPTKPRPPKANDFPSNVLFREVTERYPAKANWHTVLKFVSEVEKRLGRPATRDDLFPFYEAWCSNGWRVDNIHWLEYAAKGVVPGKSNGNGPRVQSVQDGFSVIDQVLGGM
jgi:hypothetical protein